MASGDCDYIRGALGEESKGVRILEKGVFGMLEPVFERAHVAVRGIGEGNDFRIGQKGTVLIS